jgi:alpha-beta hydrolase superfamily lysophospholipase
MTPETPAPTARGRHRGLAYALFLPEREPACGVVVLHGAGSRKENHFDFARRAVAEGMAALVYDARGHGESGGRFGPGAFEDAVAMCDLLREHAGAVALRGSSMGGFAAIFAAALDGRAAAVVAICPAPPDHLLRGLRAGRLEGFECDVAACEPWLAGLDMTAAGASLAPRTALLLMHARGDERVPFAVSERLYAAAGEPKELRLVEGGHHRSLQHDPGLQAEALRFIRRHAAGG